MSSRQEAITALKAVGIEGLPCDIQVVGRGAVDAWGKPLSFDGNSDDYGCLEDLTEFTPCTAVIRMDTGHLHYVKMDQFSYFQPYELEGNYMRHDNGGFISAGGELHRGIMTVCAAKRKAATLIGCLGFHFKGQYTTKPVEITFKTKFEHSSKGFWTSYEFKTSYARRCLLTVHVVEQDESFISVSITNMGGDEVAAVSVDASKTVADLQIAIAQELEEVEQMFDLMTPDGRILSLGTASLDILQ